MKISDMQDKTIINVNDGKNIGRISDLEIDDTGKIINFYCLNINIILPCKVINSSCITLSVLG